MKRINILAPSSTFGFNTDVNVILNALEGDGYTCAVHRRPAMGGPLTRIRGLAKGLLAHPRRADANLHLGPIFKEWIPFARKNFILPNPEWFSPGWIPLLKHFDAVFAKTQHAVDIFSGFGAKAVYTGFTSKDAFQPGHHKDFSRFLHVSSNSGKGTPRLLETWSQHPEWPTLTAVVNRAEIAASSGFRAEEKPNLKIVRDYLTDTEIRTLQNECGVHICCSEAEGYGHYIAEAMSTGAVTLTTDGAPMNEFIRPDRGFLIAVSESHEMNVARKHLFDPASLAAAVTALQHMTDSEKAALGQAARDWFLSNKTDFAPRFRATLAAAL